MQERECDDKEAKNKKDDEYKSHVSASFKLIVISIKRDLYFVKIRRVRYTKGDNEKECRNEINTIACKGNEL